MGQRGGPERDTARADTASGLAKCFAPFASQQTLLPHRDAILELQTRTAAVYDAIATKQKTISHRIHIA